MAVKQMAGRHSSSASSRRVLGELLRTVRRCPCAGTRVGWAHFSGSFARGRVGGNRALWLIGTVPCRSANMGNSRDLLGTCHASRRMARARVHRHTDVRLLHRPWVCLELPSPRSRCSSLAAATRPRRHPRRSPRRRRARRRARAQHPPRVHRPRVRQRRRARPRRRARRRARARRRR